MASGMGDYDMKLEHQILNIVKKIKKDRNRASLENIHTKLERDGCSVDKSDLRVFINCLVENKALINSSRGTDDPDKESFTVAEDYVWDEVENNSSPEIIPESTEDNLFDLQNLVT